MSVERRDGVEGGDLTVLKVRLGIGWVVSREITELGG